MNENLQNEEPKVEVEEKVVEKSNKTKKHGFFYWFVVLFGTAFIMVACYNIGYKLGKHFGEDYKKSHTKTESNSNSNVTSNEDSNVVSNENSNSNEAKLSDEEAMKLGNEQWQYARYAMFCEKFNYDENDKLGDGYHAVTNFDEVNSHFTEDNKVSSLGGTSSFKEYATESWKVSNGKYYDGSRCSRGSDMLYMSNELKIVSNEQEEIKFTATATYCDKSAFVDGKCNGKTNTKDSEFIIRKVDNAWKIVRFTLPD